MDQEVKKVEEWLGKDRTEFRFKDDEENSSVTKEGLIQKYREEGLNEKNRELSYKLKEEHNKTLKLLKEVFD